jgi:hypothetical protein
MSFVNIIITVTVIATRTNIIATRFIFITALFDDATLH